MNRREFLRRGSITGVGAIAINPAGFITAEAPDIVEASVTQLQEMMAKGVSTSAAITQEYLKRIYTIDKQGHKINSVIEVNPDAIAIAEGLDRERKSGRLRGPLHGIPVLIKDNLNTGDKMMTTAGSLSLYGHLAKSDSFVARQLRIAGAVILGKTNLSEWANFRSTHSTSGWSSRGGQTRNAYMLDRNPSGSSSGSGAATAASLCAVSIGTETDGSITAPSSVNGLVGIKPTVGLVSRAGIIPISATQDTAGPMARSVTDAAILLGAIAGIDPSDPVTMESQGKSAGDYTRFLDAGGLKGKRIGVEKKHLNAHPGPAGLFREAIKTMEDQGATIVEIELFKALDVIPDNAEFTVLLYEFRDGLNRYFAANDTRMKSLNDVIEFNKANASSTMPFFGQETLIGSNGKGDLNSQEYKDALQQTLSARKIIRDLMAANQLDAFAGITTGPAVPIDLINGDCDGGPSFTTPAAISGFPHITVPMGQVHGLPAGISFCADAYQDGALITIAYAYEQASKKRVPPQYKAGSL